MQSHEKLAVYQLSLKFLDHRRRLLADVERVVSACDHLDRAGESIPLNIARASSLWSARERMKYIAIANGSALECAAALDVLAVRKLLGVEGLRSAKDVLRSMVSMLIAWRKTTGQRVLEEGAKYKTGEPWCFDHEKLDVYRAALELNGWLADVQLHLRVGADLDAKVDKSATSIVLNIAEGNGRFGSADRRKFIAIAGHAVSLLSALLDVAALDADPSCDFAYGRQLLPRIAAMLNAWSNSLAE